MAKKNKILLYRTNIKGSTTNDIEFGELALNYNPESPFIMFKDNDGSVKKMGSLSDELGESEYYTMSQKAITEQVKMPSNYNVKYPSLSNTTLKETLSDSHIKEAIENIDSNVASVSQKIIDNEDNLNTKLNHIKNSIGLTSDLSYKTQTASTYLQDSISLSNADYLLDREVKNVNDALISEKERAEGQETAIRTEFTNADSELRSDLTTAISNEKERAEGQESAIRTEFINADSTLKNELTTIINNISGSVTDNSSELIELLNTEQSRAEGQEAAIRTEFANADSELRGLILQEFSRAETEETKIRSEFSNADENLRSELTKLIDDVSSNVSSNEEATQNLVNTEQSRAEGQEAAIRTEFANADSKLRSDLTTALSEETKRASDEEAAIRTELEDTTTTLRNELSTLINEEIDRANKEDAAIREYFNNKIDSLDAVFEQNIILDNNGKAELNHIGFSVEQENGKLITFEISEEDIASAYELERETIARKAVDGQSGQTYVSNTNTFYIQSATSLNSADVLLDKAISDLTIAKVEGAELNSLGTNVREAYKLIDSNQTQHGNYIKIYKDSSLKSVSLVEQELVFTYILSDGSENVVNVDVSKFITENEYGNGLQEINHIISAKLGEDTATNKNFLELEGEEEGKKSLVVRSVDTDRTYTTDEITVMGGPLAKLLTDVGINKIDAGTDIQTLLMTLLCKEIYPFNTTSDTWYMADEYALGNQKKISYSSPNFTTSIVAPSVSNFTTGTVEAGTKFTFTVSSNATSTGSTASTVSNLTWGYSAADDDSVDSTSTSITKTWSSSIASDTYTLKTTVNNGFGGVTKADVTGTNSSKPSYSMEVQVADGTNKITWNVTGCTYTGTLPVNPSVYMVSNLGKTDAAIKTNVISAQTKTPSAPTNSTNKSVTGDRYSFYGTKQGTTGITNAVSMTSSNIRTLGGKSFNTTFSITIPDGTSHVYIALPSDKTLTKVADTGAFGTDIVASFKANTKTNVLVEGANGYTAQNYTVYIYAPDALLGANTYDVTLTSI